MENVTSKALLVGLSVTGLGLISPEIEDKQIGSDVASSHGVNPELVRVMKRLLDRKRFPEVGEVKDAYGDLYRYFTQNTLTWSERGVRAVAAGEYLTLTREINVRKSALESAFERLLAKWPVFHDIVKAQFNGMWKEEDWPTEEKLRRRFSVRVKVRPLVDAESVKVMLGVPEEVERIKAEVQADLFRNLAGTLLDLFQRFKTFLSGDGDERGLIQKLADYNVDQHGRVVGKKFRDSAILAGRELCEVAEKLNVMGDPSLSAVIAEVRELLSIDPQALRDDSVLRVGTAKKAAAIAERIASVESVLSRLVGEAA